jgi:predicted  nucleic acid-binding Zn-ribbon protein
MQLDPASYAMKKELADLGVAVAKTRGELADLESSRDARLAAAREEGAAAIYTAAQAAKETYADALSLIDDVRGWAQEVRAYSDEVATWHARNIAEVVALQTSQEAVTETLRAKEAELNAISEQTKAELAAVAAERRMLAEQRKQNKVELSRIASERSILANAFAEGRKKGIL